MLETVVVSLVLLSGAYVVFSVFDRKMTFDRSAFPQLFSNLEEATLSNTFRLVIRFQRSSYWFLMERAKSGDDDGIRLSLCIPRVGFSESDYRNLEQTFVSHSFEFAKEGDMSRFFARVPIRSNRRDENLATPAAHAARLFMQALGLDPTARFRRGYDADAW